MVKKVVFSDSENESDAHQEFEAPQALSKAAKAQAK